MYRSKQSLQKRPWGDRASEFFLGLLRLALLSVLPSCGLLPSTASLKKESISRPSIPLAQEALTSELSLVAFDAASLQARLVPLPLGAENGQAWQAIATRSLQELSSLRRTLQIDLQAAAAGQALLQDELQRAVTAMEQSLEAEQASQSPVLVKGLEGLKPTTLAALEQSLAVIRQKELTAALGPYEGLLASVRDQMAEVSEAAAQEKDASARERLQEELRASQREQKAMLAKYEGEKASVYEELVRVEANLAGPLQALYDARAKAQYAYRLDYDLQGLSQQVFILQNALKLLGSDLSPPHLETLFRELASKSLAHPHTIAQWREGMLGRPTGLLARIETQAEALAALLAKEGAEAGLSPAGIEALRVFLTQTYRHELESAYRTYEEENAKSQPLTERLNRFFGFALFCQVAAVNYRQRLAGVLEALPAGLRAGLGRQLQGPLAEAMNVEESIRSKLLAANLAPWLSAFTERQRLLAVQRQLNDGTTARGRILEEAVAGYGLDRAEGGTSPSADTGLSDKLAAASPAESGAQDGGDKGVAALVEQLRQEHRTELQAALGQLLGRALDVSTELGAGGQDDFLRQVLALARLSLKDSTLRREHNALLKALGPKPSPTHALRDKALQKQTGALPALTAISKAWTAWQRALRQHLIKEQGTSLAGFKTERQDVPSEGPDDCAFDGASPESNLRLSAALLANQYAQVHLTGGLGNDAPFLLQPGVSLAGQIASLHLLTSNLPERWASCLQALKIEADEALARTPSKLGMLASLAAAPATSPLKEAQANFERSVRKLSELWQDYEASLAGLGVDPSTRGGVFVLQGIERAETQVRLHDAQQDFERFVERLQTLHNNKTAADDRACQANKSAFACRLEALARARAEFERLAERGGELRLRELGALAGDTKAVDSVRQLFRFQTILAQRHGYIGARELRPLAEGASTAGLVADAPLADADSFRVKPLIAHLEVSPQLCPPAGADAALQSLASKTTAKSKKAGPKARQSTARKDSDDDRQTPDEAQWVVLRVMGSADVVRVQGRWQPPNEEGSLAAQTSKTGQTAKAMDYDRVFDLTQGKSTQRAQMVIIDKILSLLSNEERRDQDGIMARYEGSPAGRTVHGDNRIGLYTIEAMLPASEPLHHQTARWWVTPYRVKMNHVLEASETVNSAFIDAQIEEGEASWQDLEVLPAWYEVPAGNSARTCPR